MNLHTFKDAVNSKRSSLANDLDDEDDEGEVNVFRKQVEGEEEDNDLKFNEIGEVIEPFNLKDERERGHFDENMNFIFNKERGEIDAWLSGIDEAAMEKGIGEAAVALKRRKALEEANAARVANAATKFTSLYDLIIAALKILQPSESFSKAMNRLSTIQKKSHTNRRLPNNLKKKNTEDQSEIKKQLDELIEITEYLQQKDVENVFSITYEELEDEISLWEYIALDGSVQGPFTSKQMHEWKALGFFSDPNSNVMVRRIRLSEDYWKLQHQQQLKATEETKSPKNDGSSTKRRLESVPEEGENKKKMRSSVEELMNDIDDENFGTTDTDPNANHASSDQNDNKPLLSTDFSSFARGEWEMIESVSFQSSFKIPLASEANKKDGEGNVESDDSDDDMPAWYKEKKRQKEQTNVNDNQPEEEEEDQIVEGFRSRHQRNMQKRDDYDSENES